MSDYSKQKKKTWDAFSLWIRWRGVFEYRIKNPEEFEDVGECITCKRVYHYKKAQAGHFIQGRTNGVLFYENGVHFQCVGCNMFKGGLIEDYYPYMLNRYGQGEIDKIKELRNKDIKFSLCELKEMETYYKTKTKEIQSKLLDN